MVEYKRFENPVIWGEPTHFTAAFITPAFEEDELSEDDRITFMASYIASAMNGLVLEKEGSENVSQEDVNDTLRLCCEELYVLFNGGIIGIGHLESETGKNDE